MRVLQRFYFGFDNGLITFNYSATIVVQLEFYDI